MTVLQHLQVCYLVKMWVWNWSRVHNKKYLQIIVSSIQFRQPSKWWLKVNQLYVSSARSQTDSVKLEIGEISKKGKTHCRAYRKTENTYQASMRITHFHVDTSASDTLWKHTTSLCQKINKATFSLKSPQLYARCRIEEGILIHLRTAFWCGIHQHRLRNSTSPEIALCSLLSNTCNWRVRKAIRNLSKHSGVMTNSANQRPRKVPTHT